MSFLGLITSLIEIIPSIAGWFKDEDAESKAKAVADIAVKLTGAKSHEQAIEIIRQDEGLKIALTELVFSQLHDLKVKTIEDRNNARKMQTAIAIHSKSRVAREFIYWYAAAITALAAIYIACITFLPIPDNSVRFADTCLGFILGTVVSAIIQFFYGSSKPVREDE